MTSLRELECQPLPNSKGLDRLRRHRVTPPPGFPLATTSFGPSLYMHIKSIRVSGHHQLAKSVLGVCTLLERKADRLGIPSDHMDDFIRQHLKHLHDIAFPRTVGQGPAWMFMCHLHAIGGKRAWDRESVERRILDWVNSDRLMVDTPSHRSELDAIFATWSPKTARAPHLSFNEFCNDPLRWGTAGGAPKVKIMGEDYRTKWAWAWSRKINQNGWTDAHDLYQDALKAHPDVAIVALKEESTKTREIITTPMASYLRQSYLTYLWGRPPLDSPIGRKGWLAQFQEYRCRWYAAIDGKNFDHHVARWFIDAVLDHLATANQDAYEVVQQEKQHLDNLHISMDNKTWKYKNGVLSGWRLTSLLDTLATEVVVRAFLKTTDYRGAFMTGTMGDDLIIGSSQNTLAPDWLVEQYDGSGMETNASKTTAGAVGEFLRKVYAPSGILGYPALGLKGCMYASPWISTYEMNNPQEVTKNWMTWLSRLLPLCLDSQREHLSSWVKRCAVRDIRGWGLKAPTEQLERLLATPISAGGLGCIEWIDSGDWCTVINGAPDRQTAWLSKFGIGSGAKTLKEDYTVSALARSLVSALANNLTRKSNRIPSVSLPSDKNISRLLVTWYFDDTIPAVHIAKMLAISLPYGLRVAGKSAILDYIMGQIKTKNGITTIQTTPELAASIGANYKDIGSAFLLSKAGSAIRNHAAAVTYLQLLTRTRTTVTRGTW